MAPDSVERIAQLFRSYTVPELVDWIRARLLGFDEVGGSRDEEAHELIAEVHVVAEEPVSTNIQKAVHALVEELAADPGAWPISAATNLLMLMDPVSIDSPRAVELTDLLMLLLEPAKGASVDAAIRFAAAHAILTLDTKASPAFWQSLYTDESYAPIVVEGLLRTDVNALPAWWPRDRPDVALERAFINLVPFIIAGPGSSVAADLIRALAPLFSQPSQKTVFHIAKALGIGDESRPAVDLRVVTTLVGSLQLVVNLLADTRAEQLTETFVSSFQRNIGAVRDTLQRHTHLVETTETLQELWRVYVDCVDRAVTHPPLALACVAELIAILPAPLLEGALIHLLEERAVDKTAVLEVLHETGSIDLEEAIALRPPVEEVILATEFPADLRDEIIVELSRREEERHARDELLEMEAAMGWEAFR